MKTGGKMKESKTTDRTTLRVSRKPFSEVQIQSVTASLSRSFSGDRKILFSWWKHFSSFNVVICTNHSLPRCHGDNRIHYNHLHFLHVLYFISSLYTFSGTTVFYCFTNKVVARGQSWTGRLQPAGGAVGQTPQKPPDCKRFWTRRTNVVVENE